jgi:hypothetical protein
VAEQSADFNKVLAQYSPNKPYTDRYELVHARCTWVNDTKGIGLLNSTVTSMAQTLVPEYELAELFGFKIQWQQICLSVGCNDAVTLHYLTNP